MKKVLITIISIIIICLTALGIIGYVVEQKENKEANLTKNEENIKEENQWVVLKADTLDINKIPGFKPGGKVVEKNEDEKNNDEGDSTKNDSKEKTVKVTEVGGLDLPWTPPYKEMEIEAIGGYTGEYVEDGSDAKKSNILSMVIKNTSDKVIDYGEILIKVSGQNEALSFKFSDLRPGTSALVLVSDGETEFNEDDKYTYLDSRNDFVDELPLMSDDVKITTNDKEITVENISDKDLNTVYVYYKTVSPGGCYLGGITYRAKFIKMDKGKKETVNTLHFSKKNSEVLMVQSVKE